MSDADPATDASGHRARLRRRLTEQGPEALQDHELIEYLLALTIPRVDTKKMAYAMLAKFGSYGALVTADAEALRRAGLSEAAIGAVRIAEASALRLLRAKIADRPMLGSWQALLDYLHADMAHRVIERVRVLYLDTRNQLIRDELASEGSIDQSAVYVREVIKRALDLSAAALVIVHNHPSGDPSPSKQDIALTRDLIAAGKPLGIAIHDHVIVGARGHSSLRAMGLI